jgi:HAD superfamily hydrolase (TIGR01509 family)
MSEPLYASVLSDVRQHAARARHDITSPIPHHGYHDQQRPEGDTTMSVDQDLASFLHDAQERVAGVYNDLSSIPIESALIQTAIQCDAEGVGHEAFEHYAHWAGVKVASYETHHEEEVRVMRAMFQRDGIEAIRPEGLALLKAAHDAGLRTGILSNELMDFQGRTWVEAQEWFGWFDIVVDSSELGARKPDPEPYEVAIELMGLPADRQVFIDDNPSYVAGGERAGLNSILLDVLEPWVAYDQAAVLLGLEPFGRLS